MNIKPLAIFVAVLAVIAGVGTVLKKNDTTSLDGDDPRVGQEILDLESLGKVTKVTLNLRDGAIDFVQSDSGDWIVENHYQLPVDFARFRGFIDDVASSVIVRKVTANKARMERLGFGIDFIRFSDADGNMLRSVEFGRNADAALGRFVMLDDSPAAYLADMDVVLRGDPNDWIIRRFYELEKQDVKAVTLTLPDGSKLAASRENGSADFSGDNLAENESLQEDIIDSFLNRYRTIRFNQAESKDNEDYIAAMENPNLASIELFDGTQYQIKVGRRTPDAQGEGGAEPDSMQYPVFVEVTGGGNPAQLDAMMANAAFTVLDGFIRAFPATASDWIETAEPEAPTELPETAESLESADNPS